MSAQPPEGDSATAGPSGLRERTPALPGSGTVNGLRAVEGGNSRELVQENPNLHDPAPNLEAYERGQRLPQDSVAEYVWIA